MFKLSTTAWFGALGLAMAVHLPASASDLVNDDLITGSNKTTPWQVCDSDSVAVDVTNLDTGLCAFRTTPAVAGITYRMSCGVTVAKFASITLVFQDAADNTLATRTTEVTEHVSGGYSVELAAPAGTVTAAIGIYGEPGSGFQDCVLIDATPTPEPTKGSISGVSWFDENGDSILDATEGLISGTEVTLFDGTDVLEQTGTGIDGSYYFGNLDVDQCYTVSFSPADPTLELGAVGGDNDALASGITNDICLTDSAPDVVDVDVPFVAIPPVLPPADYAICGVSWVDRNANGVFDGTDTTKPHVNVVLFDANNNRIAATSTNGDGNYAFFKLTEGDYLVRFLTPDGHEPTTNAGQPLPGSSVIGEQGRTPVFNIPGSGNTPDGSACTIQNVNGGFIELPVALDPTTAEDDSVAFDVGVDFTVEFLANDAPCDGSVIEVDLLGHNVPGVVTLNAQQQFVVSNTTAFGQYSIEYGIRGACGSYDTATILVELVEVIPPAPPAAPDAPECRAETGGARHGGVDIFTMALADFATSYNFYDRNRDLLGSVVSANPTIEVFIEEPTSNLRRPYLGKWEREFNGFDNGIDQTAVYYATAVENGVESEFSLCVRTLVSPIALDLENKGRIQRVVGEYNVDIDGDGIKELLGEWFAPSAGILVTGDAKGQINGTQLFGNVPGVYSDGYEELATLDKNADGRLTGIELKSLAIWNDLDSDTVVDEGELSKLADHQIVALSLEHYKYMSRATRENGKSVLMEDVWFPMAPLAAR